MSDIFDLFKKISAEKAGTPKSAGVEWIIAGLGNIGTEYTFTRHNTGFLCMGVIARKLGVTVDKARFHALTARSEIAGHSVLLLCPTTYMNASGDAVAEAAEFYKVPPERVLVLVDDINLDVGRMRFRENGSAGSHNGLKSIIYRLNSDTFPRVRIGVGKKPECYTDLADWVLSRFGDTELATLEKLFERTCEGLPLILDGKKNEASQFFNSPLQ